MDDLIVGIKLRADGKGAVAELRSTGKEFEKLGISAGTGARAIEQTSKSTERAKKAQGEWSASMKLGSGELGKLSTAGAAAARAIDSGAQAAKRAKDAMNDQAQATDKLGAALDRARKLALGVFAGVGLVEFGRGLITTADQMRQLEGRLALVVTGSKALASVQSELFQIAQQNLTPLAETVSLYTRLAMATQGTGMSTARLLSLTEAVQRALRISGASTAEAASLMQQFSQAMASGVLRGEEFNAMMESGPRLAQALAAGLGVSTGALRAMAAEGELTRDRIIEALESQYDVLERQSAALPKTVGGAWQQLRNAVQAYVADVDKSSGASATLASAISSLAGNVKTLASAVGELLQLGLFVGGGVLLGNMAKYAGALTTHLTKLGAVLGTVKTVVTEIGVAGAMLVGGGFLTKLPQLIAKLQTSVSALSLGQKGGAIGFALFGGTEVGSIVQGWAGHIDTLSRSLDGLFARLERPASDRPEPNIRDLGFASGSGTVRTSERAAQAAAARGRLLNNQMGSSLNLPETLTRERRAPDFSVVRTPEQAAAALRNQEAAGRAREQEARDMERQQAQAIASAERAARAAAQRSQDDQAEYYRALTRMQAEQAKDEAAQLDGLRKKRREQLASRLEDHRQALRTEVEAEQERHALVLRDLREAVDARVATEAEALALRARAEVEHQERLSDIQEQSQRAANEALGRQQERQRELMLQPFKNALDGMQNAFANAFESIFSGGVNSFKDLGATIKQVFIRLAAEIASLLVFQPIVGGLLNSVGASGLAAQLGLGGAGGGSLIGGSGAGGSAFSGGSLLSSLVGGFQSDTLASLGIGIADKLGFGAFGQSAMAGAGLNAPFGIIGGLGANLLGLGGGTASTVLGGVGGLVGGGIGSSLGATLGSAAGPLGAIAGSFLGSALGGLFGGKPKRKTGMATLDGGTMQLLSKGGKGNDGSGAAVIAEQLGALLNQALSTAGGSIAGGTHISVREFLNSKKFKGPANTLFLAGNSIGDYATSQQLVSQGGLGILRSSAVAGTIDDEFKAALAQSRTIEEFIQLSTAIKANTEATKAQTEAQSEAQGPLLRREQLSLQQQLGQVVSQARSLYDTSGLLDFRKSLAFGELSPENARDRLAKSRIDLSDLSRRALAGDREAIGQFPGAAQQVLGLGRDVYASGTEFQSIFRDVNTTLDRVISDVTRRQEQLEASLGIDFARVMQEASTAQIEALKLQTTDIVRALEDVTRELKKRAA